MCETPTNGMLQNNTRILGTSLNGCNVWIFTLVFAIIATTTSTTTIYCNGYTLVPQLHATSQQYGKYRGINRRNKDRSIPFVEAVSREIARSALPTSSVITLDGQEIRQEITAMNNIIFVKVKEALSTTTGGIVIPDQSKQRPTEGTVVACGPGKIHPHTGKRISNPISVGMNVL